MNKITVIAPKEGITLEEEPSGGAVIKNLSANAETQKTKRIRFLAWEDPLEQEWPSPHQYSCLGTPADRESWQATVLGITDTGHD